MQESHQISFTEIDMKQKYAYFSKNILFFTIGSFVPKLLQFLLVPLYTSYLTTAEYGISDLISVTVSLFIPVFTLGIQDAVLRFALDDNYKKEDVFSAAMKIILAGFLLLVLGSGFVSGWEFGSFDKQYIPYFLIMYLVSAMSNSVSLFCRGTDQIATMVVAGILNTVVTLVSNILFLTVFRLGLAGFLQANILGSLTALLFCIVRARLYCYVKFRTPRNVYRDMTIFSIPLIFNVIAWWINSALDKYILTWFAGVAVSGIYAVSYKIPNILSVFQGIFFQAWSVSAVKEFDREDSDGFFTTIYSLVAFAMAAMCSAVMIVNVPLAKLLFARDFFEAWKFTSPLLVSAVFNAMSLLIGSIFNAVKDSKTLAVSTGIGAAVNTVCNLLLIPRFGAYGAAVATLAGYAVVWCIRQRVLKKHIRMRVDRIRELTTYLFLIAQMAVSSRGNASIPMQMIVFGMILVLYRRELVSICGQVLGWVDKRIKG